MLFSKTAAQKAISVVEAGSGGEDLKILSENKKIDLFLTDQAMPRMNGAQLPEEVVKTNPTEPIILATG